MVRNRRLRDRLLFFILLFVWSYLRFLLGLFNRLGFGGNIVSFMSGKRRISPKNIHAKSTINHISYRILKSPKITQTTILLYFQHNKILIITQYIVTLTITDINLFRTIQSSFNLS